MIGSQKFSSGVAKDAGKTPTWCDQFTFKILNDQLLTFTIFDYDSASSNDYIGNLSLMSVASYFYHFIFSFKAEGSVSIANAFAGGKKVEYANCVHKGKSAG